MSPAASRGLPLPDESELPAPRTVSRGRRILQAGFGMGLAVGLIVWGLPAFGHTSWSKIFEIISTQVPLWHGVGFQLIMLAGLYCYTFTFTGSLPGLSHGRALLVNMCGSSVANLLPGGGAAGLAATYTICRSWGFSRSAISTSAIVTGVWNVMARLVLPVVAILTLYVGNTGLPQALQDAAVAGAGTGLTILGTFVAFFVSERASHLIAAGLDRILRPIGRRTGRWLPGAVEQAVVAQRGQLIDVVRHGWLSLTFGMVGFFGLYFVLFYLLAVEVEMDIHIGTLFAAFAINRILSAVAITPGGLGVNETVTVAVLIGWGANPADATAVVFLFSIFTHLMEVPLGALGWGIWINMRKGQHAVDPPASA